MSEDTQETGGSLREKLEAALTSNASLVSELTGYKASEVITAKGYKHVTPEDLKGVKLDEIEAKAEELEATKAALAESVLKTVLKDKLGDSGDLDSLVQGLLGKADGADAGAIDRIRSVGKAKGLPPEKLAERSDLRGPDRLKAHFGAI